MLKEATALITFYTNFTELQQSTLHPFYNLNVTNRKREVLLFPFSGKLSENNTLCPAKKRLSHS